MTTAKCTPGELPGLLRRHAKTLDRRVRDGVHDTAMEAVGHIQAGAPKAFGDLRSSAHWDRHLGVEVTRVSAPHAGAVEAGSAPHMPDIDALERWVKLRGAQSLTLRGNARTFYPRSLGHTTPGHAASVRGMLRELTQHSPGQHLPVDAPRQVALAIARHIQHFGTAPHWFVRNSLPGIAMRLAHNLRKAVKGATRSPRG